MQFQLQFAASDCQTVAHFSASASASLSVFIGNLVGQQSFGCVAFRICEQLRLQLQQQQQQ